MNADERQARVDQYEAQIKEWDAEAASWEAGQRAEYESARDDFRREMSTWGDKAEAEWDEFSANLEQGWHGLRAKWHQWVGGEDDDESAESGNLLDDIDDPDSHS